MSTDTTDTCGPAHGQVFKKALGHYYVRADGREVTCRPSSKLRKELVYGHATDGHAKVRDVREIRADPVAVGDHVAFVEAPDGTGLLQEVLPRRNRLSRATRAGEQVLVANIDQVVIVVAAAMPSPTWNLVDRYIVSAASFGIPSAICLTKTDLSDDPTLFGEARNYEKLGYRVAVTSAIRGEGIEAFRDLLAERLSVLVGKSGVGKSTLLNTIQPGLGLRVAEPSRATNKGRHTTSHIEMFGLEFGGHVVDTPGSREFGLWEIHGDEVAEYFPEMTDRLGQCKFSVCSHTHEPGCAIKQALEEGDITQRRYDSYCALRGD